MSGAILEKARELGLALSNSKEFINVREAEATMMQNPEAQIIIQEFQTKQHNLQTMQAQGMSITEDQRMEIEEIHHRMFSNPDISNFFQAQESFENILDQVNKIISESIGISQDCGCEEDGHDDNCGCGCC